MIELVPTGAHQVVGLRIEGRISGEDLDLAAREIDARLKVHPRISIYAEIHGLTGMSLEALAKDFRYSLAHLRDVEKEAIVSDRRWLALLAQVGGRLFPSIDVRHFSPEDKEAALEWLRA